MDRNNNRISVVQHIEHLAFRALKRDEEYWRAMNIARAAKTLTGHGEPLEFASYLIVQFESELNTYFMFGRESREFTKLITDFLGQIQGFVDSHPLEEVSSEEEQEGENAFSYFIGETE